MFTVTIHWYYLSAESVGIVENDIFQQELMLSHMFNTFKHIRQELNGTGVGTNRKAWMVAEITFIKYVAKGDRETMQGTETKQTTMAELKELLAKILPAYDLTLTKNAEWIGMMTPILASYSLFKARIEELRMGHTKLPRGQDEVEIAT